MWKPFKHKQNTLIVKDNEYRPIMFILLLFWEIILQSLLTLSYIIILKSKSIYVFLQTLHPQQVVWLYAALPWLSEKNTHSYRMVIDNKCHDAKCVCVCNYAVTNLLGTLERVCVHWYMVWERVCVRCTLLVRGDLDPGPLRDSAVFSHTFPTDKDSHNSENNQV